MSRVIKITLYSPSELYRQRKRDEQLPTCEILRELQVTMDHFNEFQKMLNDGELHSMSFNLCGFPTIRLRLRGGSVNADTGDWLILDKKHRWLVMDNDYHKRLLSMGKIVVINYDSINLEQESTL